MQSVSQAAHPAAADAGSATVELLLFRLGADRHGQCSELFAFKVVHVREILAMPPVTAIAGSLPHVLGVVNLRGAIMQVIDLPSLAGCTPASGLNIMLVTDAGGTAQASAVEAVEEIVLIEALDLVAGGHGAAGGMISAIARIDAGQCGAQLAQVLDIDTVLRRLTV